MVLKQPSYPSLHHSAPLIVLSGYQAFNWEQGYGDFSAVPDLSTLRLVPWLERTALVLCDVVEELNDFGYPMQAEWFAPHLNFRFPLMGDFSARGVDVEVRLALEQWHVMGEEGAPGGTANGPS